VWDAIRRPRYHYPFVSRQLIEKIFFTSNSSTNWNVLHGADPTVPAGRQVYNEYPDLPDSLRQQINEALLCYLSQPPSVCNAQLSQTIANLIAAINALFEADYAIRFRGFPQQHYGFDSLMYQPMVDDYNFLTVAHQPYRVAWKSVEAGRSDSVLLLTPFAQLPDSLHFETNSRTPVPHHEHACGAGCTDNGAAILPVTGGEHNKTYQIYPVQTRRDSLGNPERKYAGKLNVVSYNKKATQVVIVPINSAGNLAAADAEAIQSQLNDIYRPAVASFTVELLPSLPLGWFESEAQNTLDSTNSAFYADYNAQMQRINQEINRLPGYDPEKYYLIVVQNAQGGIKGFMPRARNKGFIVAAGHGSLSDLGRTMAHELGHGAFRLRHPWEQFSGLAPGQTDNLMDYASGTRLHHYQWHIVHNPPPLAGLLEGDEEGELARRIPEWRLHIFSPQISRAMRSALQSGNIIEQRRLTYWALNNQFPDSWAFGIGGEDFGTASNRAALLKKYHDNHVNFRGLHLVLYDFFDSNDCITDKPSSAVVIKPSEEWFFEAGASGPVKDEAYPVDINLWNGNGVISDGSYYYNEYDFMGYYAEGMRFLTGKGVIAGRMRGYGYIEYFVRYSQGLNFIPSFAFGIIYGNFRQEYSRYPNDFPSGATPGTFTGIGTVANINGIGRWNSFDPEINRIVWIGETLEYVGSPFNLINGIVDFRQLVPSRILNASEFINLSGFSSDTQILPNFAHQGGITRLFYTCTNMD